MKIWKYLEEAAFSARREEQDIRAHCIGAVGLRADGALVRSRNGFSRTRMPSVHAEARLLRKLDPGSVVFTARVRKSGELGMSRPCFNCLLGLLLKGVSTVYYTLDEPCSYGCIDLTRVKRIISKGGNNEYVTE